MDEAVLEKLEYPKVLEMLAERCSWALGREMALALRPAAERDEVERRLRETSEAAEAWRFYPTLPLGGIRDVRETVRRAGLGLMLEPSELLALADTLRAARRLRRFLGDLKEEQFPLLRAGGAGIGEFRPLEEEINSAIRDDATVDDNASPGLARVRRQMRQSETRLRERLDGYLRSSEYQKVLQEVLVTVRDGRYVLPVKQEYRSQMPGLVHDQSASGSTLFIEPMPVVELNNELRRLQAEERREVEEVLRGLTVRVAAYRDELALALETLGWLDLSLSKGRLSQDMRGAAPVCGRGAGFRLREARHPLLGTQAVPVSLEMGQDYDTLIITGPNTGGKTVTLKTVGLLVVMAQAGLHIPAEPESRLPVYREIFADIGDEQSIEQSLSTFSSHMVKIVQIVRRAGPDTLVLLDELGAGTDPAEGAALAMAILEHLRQSGAHTVATTHYGQLKFYAYNTPRVENASMEFDELSLRPTYRLLVGLPGGSNALAIASRLGLDLEVVERARGYLAPGEEDVGLLIQALTRDRHQAEEARRKAEDGARLVEEELQQLARERASLREQARAESERLQREARQVLDRARRESEEMLKELRTRLTQAAQEAQLEAARQAREGLLSLEREVEEKTTPAGPAPVRERAARPIAAGDAVEVVRLGQHGVALGTPNAQGEIPVQLGAMRVVLPAADVVPVRGGSGRKASPPPADSGAAGLASAKSREISPQVDLRGLTVEEAWELVAKHVDDACLAGLQQVVLIHGKGTGALRNGLQRLLREDPRVREFRMGGAGEGGSGVTVVTLQ